MEVEEEYYYFEELKAVELAVVVTVVQLDMEFVAVELAVVLEVAVGIDLGEDIGVELGQVFAVELLVAIELAELAVELVVLVVVVEDIAFVALVDMPVVDIHKEPEHMDRSCMDKAELGNHMAFELVVVGPLQKEPFEIEIHIAVHNDRTGRVGVDVYA